MVTIQDDTTPEPVEVIEVQVRCEAEENCYSPRLFYTITIVDDQGENQTILCVEGIVWQTLCGLCVWREICRRSILCMC